MRVKHREMGIVLIVGNENAAAFLRGLKNNSPRLRIEAQREGYKATALVYLEDLDLDHRALALLNAGADRSGRYKVVG